MATDDERREVAERLRKLSGRIDMLGFDCPLAEAVRGHEFCEMPCDECHSRLSAELADLIDPDTTGDTTEAAADTTKCVCDATATHTDASATCDMSQSCRDAVACDREALLGLADEIETDGVDCYVVSTQYVLDEYARRIRDACGEVGA